MIYLNKCTIVRNDFLFLFQNSRISKLYQASWYIIQTKIPDNSWLGIVWFEAIAYRKKELTQVTSQQVRDELISALPNTVLGSTCIGCGIDAALEVRFVL